MSGKRIQRKHFLAAMGAAVVATFGGGKLLTRRDSTRDSAVTAAMRTGQPLPADHRAVARTSQS